PAHGEGDLLAVTRHRHRGGVVARLPPPGKGDPGGWPAGAPRYEGVHLAVGVAGNEVGSSRQEGDTGGPVVKGSVDRRRERRSVGGLPTTRAGYQDRGPEAPRSTFVADRAGAFDGKDVPYAVGVTGNEVGGLRLECNQTCVALVVRNRGVARRTVRELAPGRGRDRRAGDQLRVLEPSAICARGD